MATIDAFDIRVDTSNLRALTTELVNTKKAGQDATTATAALDAEVARVGAQMKLQSQVVRDFNAALKGGNASDLQAATRNVVELKSAMTSVGTEAAKATTNVYYLARETRALIDEALSGRLRQGAGSLFLLLTRGLGQSAAAIGGYIAALAIPAAVIASIVHYRSEIDQTNATLRTLGAASGTTTSQLMKMAESAAAVGTNSIATYRQFGLELAKVGASANDIQKFMSSLDGYMKATGDNAQKATEALVKMASDPVKALEALGKQTGAVSIEQVQYAKYLENTGQAQRAISVTADALSNVLDQQKGSVGGLSGAWNALKSSVSNAFEAMGKALNAPSPQEALEGARQNLEALQRRAQGQRPNMMQAGVLAEAASYPGSGISAEDTDLSPRGVAQGQIAGAQQAVEDARKRVEAINDAAAAAQKAAQQFDILLKAEQDADSVDPFSKKKAALQQQIEVLQKAIDIEKEYIAADEAATAYDQAKIDNLNKYKEALEKATLALANLRTETEKETQKNQDSIAVLQADKNQRDALNASLEAQRFLKNQNVDPNSPEGRAYAASVTGLAKQKDVTSASDELKQIQQETALMKQMNESMGLFGGNTKAAAIEMEVLSAKLKNASVDAQALREALVGKQFQTDLTDMIQKIRELNNETVSRGGRNILPDPSKFRSQYVTPPTTGPLAAPPATGAPISPTSSVSDLQNTQANLAANNPQLAATMGIPTSGSFSVAPGVNTTVGNEPLLTNAAQMAAGGLPPGYSVTETEGYNASGHVPDSQHHLGNAADFAITGPGGRIPNEGEDTTGLYTKFAELMAQAIEKLNPAAASNLRWGGNFGARGGPISANSPADLMHFDLKGYPVQPGQQPPTAATAQPQPGTTTAPPMVTPNQQVSTEDLQKWDAAAQEAMKTMQGLGLTQDQVAKATAAANKETQDAIDRATQEYGATSNEVKALKDLVTVRAAANAAAKAQDLSDQVKKEVDLEKEDVATLQAKLKALGDNNDKLQLTVELEKERAKLEKEGITGSAADQAMDQMTPLIKQKVELTNAIADGEKALQQWKQMADQVAGAIGGAFDKAIDGGEKFINILKDLGKEISKIGVQHFLTDPLKKMFESGIGEPGVGGGAGSGLLGALGIGVGAATKGGGNLSSPGASNTSAVTAGANAVGAVTKGADADTSDSLNFIQKAFGGSDSELGKLLGWGQKTDTSSSTPATSTDQPDSSGTGGIYDDGGDILGGTPYTGPMAKPDNVHAILQVGETVLSKDHAQDFKQLFPGGPAQMSQMANGQMSFTSPWMNNIKPATAWDPSKGPNPAGDAINEGAGPIGELALGFGYGTAAGAIRGAAAATPGVLADISGELKPGANALSGWLHGSNTALTTDSMQAGRSMWLTQNPGVAKNLGNQIHNVDLRSGSILDVTGQLTGKDALAQQRQMADLIQQHQWNNPAGYLYLRGNIQDTGDVLGVLNQKTSVMGLSKYIPPFDPMDTGGEILPNGIRRFDQGGTTTLQMQPGYMPPPPGGPVKKPPYWLYGLGIAGAAGLVWLINSGKLKSWLGLQKDSGSSKISNAHGSPTKVSTSTTMATGGPTDLTGSLKTPATATPSPVEAEAMDMITTGGGPKAAITAPPAPPPATEAAPSTTGPAEHWSQFSTPPEMQGTMDAPDTLPDIAPTAAATTTPPAPTGHTFATGYTAADWPGSTVPDQSATASSQPWYMGNTFTRGLYGLGSMASNAVSSLSSGISSLTSTPNHGSYDDIMKRNGTLTVQDLLFDDGGDVTSDLQDKVASQQEQMQQMAAGQQQQNLYAEANKDMPVDIGPNLGNPQQGNLYLNPEIGKSTQSPGNAFFMSLLSKGEGVGGSLFKGLFGGSDSSSSNNAVDPTTGESAFYGGLVGSITSKVTLPRSAWDNAKSYASGGYAGMNPGEVPVLAHQGERILNSQETAAYDAGSRAQSGNTDSAGRPVNVTMHISTPDANSFRASQEQIQRSVRNSTELAQGRNG